MKLPTQLKRLNHKKNLRVGVAVGRNQPRVFSFMDYSEYLQAPEWQAKRLEILDRDWHICQICMSGKNLQVHHKAYIVGRLPWEYDNQYLITLCGSCHAHFHAHDTVPTLQQGDPIIEASTRIANSLKSLDRLM